MKAKGEKMNEQEIRQMLKDLNWSEEKLADEAGVTAWAVRKWLRGESHPSRIRARKLRTMRDQLLGNGAAK